MFKITTENFGSRLRYILNNSNGNSRCGFVPSFGANINELQLSRSGKTFQLLDGYKAEPQLLSNEKSRNIHLLPFPNRIRDGKYFFDGKEYTLDINKPDENNAIHGFFWNKAFEITDEKCSGTSATVTLQHYYNGDYKGYPFPFIARYGYELKDEEFLINVAVINSGKNSMPLGIGWHPYFTFNKRVDELQLQLPECSILETDARLIPNGKRKHYPDFQSLQTIGSHSFDTAFKLDGKNAFETKLLDAQSGVTIRLQQDASFRYLQVYIPPDRNSIALEPMTCPANAFNSGDGLIVLKEKERFEGRIKVSLG